MCFANFVNVQFIRQTDLINIISHTLEINFIENVNTKLMVIQNTQIMIIFQIIRTVVARI